MFMNEFDCNSLKVIRELAGFTQREVESSLGLRNLTMRDYESGRLKLPASMAVKLSKLYRVTLEELLGLQTKEDESIFYSSFRNLFSGRSFHALVLDPVISAYIESFKDELIDKPIFEIIVNELSQSQRREVVFEISKFLFSLARIDSKVYERELNCIRSILSDYSIENKYNEIIIYDDELYFPKSIPKVLERIELRHFVIWLLFYFALADREINFREVEYIQKCAEALKINKSNFLFIKDKFVKESI